jgi:hypothetical protein
MCAGERRASGQSPAGGTSGHNRPVRRALAALLLVMLVVTAAADGVVCADGCRMPAPADHARSTGACAFCLGSVLAPDVRVVVAPQTVTRLDPQPRDRSVLAGSAAAVFHPPRRS